MQIFRREGVDAVWQAFLDDPSSAWTRAFTLVVLGSFVRKTGAV